MALQKKRHFRRYKKDSFFTIESDRMSYKCKLIDYCLDGIGAMVTGRSSLNKGDLVKVRLREPLLDFTGEIVWAKSVSGMTRVGLRNIERMEGLVRDFRLSDTLIGLQRTLTTGVLTFNSGDTSKKVYVKNGDMIFASSNREEDRLGDLLLREGIITLDQYNHSVAEMKETGQKQGAALVRLGYLRPEELVTAVRYYVEEIIRSLFSLETGSFSFVESPLPTHEVITLKLSVANLIYSGVKQAAARGHFEAEFPSVDCVPFFSSNPLNLFQDIELDITGKKIVSLIDGKTSLRDIIHISWLDEFETLKTVYALMNVRVIETSSEGNNFTEIPREIIGDTFEKSPDTEMAPELSELIEHMDTTCESLGYYGILGVKEHASLPEIKRAYYSAAKTYHPDMHFRQADESMKAKLSRIFSYIHEAYSTLSNPVKKAEYDRLTAIRPARLNTAQDRARATFEEGKSHLGSHDYGKAEMLFGQATYFDRSVSEYHYHYGLALMKQRKLEKAAKAMEAALRLEPYNTTYLSELGFLYMDLGFSSRAGGLFRKALRRSPDHGRSLEGLRRIDQLQSSRT